ncbi:trimethylamine methyltransferase family protein [Nitratireductor alexandrii]|uniref:trimethylamine methyltransferase family protein n=1 Tax=Nitratireductor alexandrii TaxID=2448161 RepID=UPI000FD88CC0|nr:trimethylamine methyltransferase family protein [Nitratireductor alexandrii]
MAADAIATPHAAPRADRRTRRQPRNGGEAVLECGAALRRIPAYALLDDDALAAIEEQADWILSEIGIEFRGDEEALTLFRRAGATVNDARVRFDPGHTRALCATAPRIFTLTGRDPKNSLVLGGDHLVFMPGYGSPFVSDLDRGRRYAELEDFRNFVRLTFMSPYLHHSGGTVCEPTDIPVNKRHLDMVAAHLTLSTKPFMGSVTAPERAADSIAMARIAFGAEFMAQNAVIQANINVNSPLVFDDTMSGALRAYAAAGQSVAVSPAIFGGAMGPVSPAAVAAQTLAEGMAGIALAQLVRPGCSCVLGSFHSTMNLKSGALTFGSPEAGLATLALGQLGRRLGVPVRSGGGQITAANAPDGQAMADSASAMWATVLSGANMVWHAAGWLEGGLTMSYEKFVMDLDQCGAMLRLIRGFATDAEAMGRDAYRETGPGQNFLSTSHTLRHFRTANHQPDIPEAGPYETWVEAGRPDLAQRANRRWKDMLAAYEAPPMDPGAAEALADFVTRRKAEMPDAWY